MQSIEGGGGGGIGDGYLFYICITTELVLIIISHTCTQINSFCLIFIVFAASKTSLFG